MVRSQDNTPDPDDQRDEEKEKKKKSDRERRAEARKELAKRVCSKHECHHVRADHAELAGKDSHNMWCYNCQDLCPKVKVNRGEV
jgi:hypothetical protein